MTDAEDAMLRAQLIDPEADRPDPAFAAALLRRLGARRRLRRYASFLLLGLGTLGPLAILAGEVARTAGSLEGRREAVVAAVAVMTIVVILFALRRRTFHRHS